MKQMRRVLSVIMMLAMVMGTISVPVPTKAAETKAEAVEEINDHVLYIYSFNNEVEQYVEYFKAKYPEYEDLIVFANSNCDSGNEAYLKHIDFVAKDTTGRAGVVAVEETDVKAILGSSVFYNLEDIGLTNKDFSKAYEYTKQVATFHGKLKGATWQCCAGGFIYNRKIARKVFGTDDPDQIQKLVKNWKVFNETAAKLKKNGYYMLSGLEDAGRALADDYSSATHKKKKALINREIKQYIDEMIVLNNKAYTKNTTQFTDKWYENMNSADSDVFGFFGPSWFLGFTMNDVRVEQLNEGFNLCEGPSDFNWGGTYFGVSKNCPNPGLASLFIRTICIDTESMYELAVSEQSYPNNVDAVEKLRNTEELKFNKIHVQNAFTIFDQRAERLNKKFATKYDRTIQTSLNDTISDYISKGKKITYNDFVEKYKENFKKNY